MPKTFSLGRWDKAKKAFDVFFCPSCSFLRKSRIRYEDSSNFFRTYFPFFFLDIWEWINNKKKSITNRGTEDKCPLSTMKWRSCSPTKTLSEYTDNYSWGILWIRKNRSIKIRNKYHSINHSMLIFILHHWLLTHSLKK